MDDNHTKSIFNKHVNRLKKEKKKLHYVAANFSQSLYEEFKELADNQTRTINSAIIEAAKLYIKHFDKIKK